MIKTMKNVHLMSNVLRSVISHNSRIGEIITLTLYEVQSNSDLTEGRGYTTSLGFYTNKTVAQHAAKGKYVMGTDCPIKQTNVECVITQDGDLFLLGDKIDVSDSIEGKIRAHALSKLSVKEIEVLGLKLDDEEKELLGKGNYKK